MHVFNQETLIKILSEQPGVKLVSYGKARDAFQLPVDVPYWVSGFGGKYEMKHTHVPAGVMVAVGNLEDLDLNDDLKLRAQLKEIDIYPTGHSGDFTGTSLDNLTKWFTDRSRLDNDVNNQTPIAHAKNLTAAGLGDFRFHSLVEYLADNMNLFKSPDVKVLMTPADRGHREQIVEALLEGLSKTVRYTRMDDPAIAYQITGQVLIEKGDDSAINMFLTEERKILVLRQHKNGLFDITPLDRAMLGRTWVVADGQPLGDRGQVELSHIVARANAIENEGSPTAPLPYIRPLIASVAPV